MIKVVTSGLYTTLQDLGRFGYRNKGVPVSGAMDQNAVRLANQLIGNHANAPVLEFTLIGPTLHFEENAIIAITGATFSAEIDNVEVTLNKSFEILADSTLTLKNPKKGVYGYLAIKGGFKSEKILESFSYYKGITEKCKIESGDHLFITTEVNSTKINDSENKIPLSISENKIKVFKGPEFEFLSENIQEKLLLNMYTISTESNRMAILLNGVGDLSANEIITAPVQPGTVQLTPSGNLIILMRDSQTTGGYARVLQLTENAINILSQKRPLEKIQFKF